MAAGLPKALDRQATVVAIDAYDLLSPGAVELLAVVLPWLEILIGLFLILGLYARFASVAAAILMAGFLGAIVQAKARGLSIDCGCFGGGGPGDGVGWLEIGRDLAFFAAAAFLVWRPQGVLQLDRHLDKGSGT